MLLSVKVPNRGKNKGRFGKPEGGKKVYAGLVD
jgi:hypothetical protein